MPIPGVAVFTGHRLDEVNREAARFPASLESSVKAAIVSWLQEHNVRAGVCSAANGADILFLEALQSFEGSDTRIVLPFSEAEFLALLALARTGCEVLFEKQKQAISNA